MKPNFKTSEIREIFEIEEKFVIDIETKERLIDYLTFDFFKFMVTNNVEILKTRNHRLYVTDKNEFVKYNSIAYSKYGVIANMVDNFITGISYKSLFLYTADTRIYKMLGTEYIQGIVDKAEITVDIDNQKHNDLLNNLMATFNIDKNIAEEIAETKIYIDPAQNIIDSIYCDITQINKKYGIRLAFDYNKSRYIWSYNDLVINGNIFIDGKKLTEIYNLWKNN